MNLDSRLLMDESPLTIQRSLAKAVGLNEAIVLQQLHYWLRDAVTKGRESNFKEGYYWVWNRVEDWQKQFPWWSPRTVRRIFDELERSGLIITGAFNKMPLDRTKWYRINYEALRSATGENVASTHPELSNWSNWTNQSNNAKSTIGSFCPNGEILQNQRLGQNDQSMCPNWTDATVQNDHHNNQRILTKEYKEERRSRVGTRDAIAAGDDQELETPLPVNNGSIGGLPPTPPNSAAPPASPTRRRVKRPTAASVYPTLARLEDFEKLWVWYCGKCKQVEANPGDKVLAAIAWRDTLEVNPELIEDFKKGAALFFKQTSVGVPHLERFIAGGVNHPTPYWQSALELAQVPQGTSSGFIQELSTSSLPVYTAEAIAFPEIDPHSPSQVAARQQAKELIKAARQK